MFYDITQNDRINDKCRQNQPQRIVYLFLILGKCTISTTMYYLCYYGV